MDLLTKTAYPFFAGSTSVLAAGLLANTVTDHAFDRISKAAFGRSYLYDLSAKPISGFKSLKLFLRRFDVAYAARNAESFMEHRWAAANSPFSHFLNRPFRCMAYGMCFFVAGSVFGLAHHQGDVVEALPEIVQSALVGWLQGLIYFSLDRFAFYHHLSKTGRTFFGLGMLAVQATLAVAAYHIFDHATVFKKKSNIPELESIHQHE